jgi:hydrogenase maturation protease
MKKRRGATMNAPLNILIIGIGNRFRGDDAAGLCVADRLRAGTIDGAAVIESSGEAAELMEMWVDTDHVIVVDAVRSGAPAGAVHRFDARANSLPSQSFQTSTHSFGLAEAVELARSLGRLPRRLIVYGIEGSDFGHGSALSAPVAGALDEVAARIGSDVCEVRAAADNAYGGSA